MAVPQECLLADNHSIMGEYSNTHFTVHAVTHLKSGTVSPISATHGPVTFTVGMPFSCSPGAATATQVYRPADATPAAGQHRILEARWPTTHPDSLTQYPSQTRLATNDDRSDMTLPRTTRKHKRAQCTQ